MSTQNLVEKFIYSCSHDLRSPVSSIQGLVRIAEYYPRHDEIHKCLEMIEACTHKMDKLITGLQEYMITSQRQLVIEQINIHPVICEAVTEFRTQLDTYQIDLTIDVQPSLTCSIDKQSLLSILKHLIANSISFHDPDKAEKKINIRAHSNSECFSIDVTDNGKGISESQQERIFDVFFRGSESSIGLGMGLFLSKSMVDKLHGSISCHSELNRGTSIHVAF